ncbi:MAG: hypothetical protein KJZ83_18055 [Burkholderiaceae bacterium]|nr:hypothetical protein [Burkholderiaceae bacterium]
MSSDAGPPVVLTPAAASRILSEADAADLDEVLIRFAACVGEDGTTIEYGMGFDERREQDTAIDIDGVTILISPPSLDLLAGTTVDFVEISPGEHRFIFAAPERGRTPGSSPKAKGGGDVRG